MKKQYFILGLLVFMLFVRANCKKETNNNTTVNLSIAQIVEGGFSGSGKYMPGNVKLGTFNSCQEPPWSSYQKTGSTTAIISSVNDSTVNVKLTSSIYSNSFNKDYILRKNGNIISSTDKVLTYYISTKSLSIFLRASYVASSGCFTGANYFYAFEGFSVAPVNATTYIFTSLEVFEFTGSK